MGFARAAAELRRPRGAPRSSLSASFSADGTHVVMATILAARVWDLREEPPSFVDLRGHQGPVYSAWFSADGAHVVTASGDRTARVWDLRAKTPSFVALEHQDVVVSASFSADGTHVVTTSDKQTTARVWDLRAQPPTFVALEGHQDKVDSAVVQHRRNACGHRVFRQDGTGVGFARGAADFRHLGGASGSSPFPVVQRGRHARRHGV